MGQSCVLFEVLALSIYYMLLIKTAYARLYNRVLDHNSVIPCFAFANTHQTEHFNFNSMHVNQL